MIHSLGNTLKVTWLISLLIIHLCIVLKYIFYFAALLSNIRTQVLIKLIKPYTRVHIPYIAEELNIEESDVESLLVTCILDE